MIIRSINPFTGQVVQEYKELSTEIVKTVMGRVDDEFHEWRRVSFGKRAECMNRAAELLRSESGKYAKLMAEEMGKPLREGKSEAEKCAWVCEYYAENAEKFLGLEEIDTGVRKSYVSYKPLGVILAVMPWNFPFWQVFRFAAPNLMAGNAGILKHASNVPGCAMAIEKIFKDAGFPPNLFRTVLVGSTKVDELIEDERIKAVTLTGSTPAGKAVAAKAGYMLKKTVLELGGSDPYVILPDADIENAAKACVTSRLINSGQSCIAAKRFIVVKSIMDDFLEQIVKEMNQKRYGDPMDPRSDIGPMARIDLRDDLHRQVDESLEKGARCLLGGTVPDGPAAFYPPTVLAGVTPGMPAYDEELFGPVAAVIPAEDESDAIRIANNTSFGLGAAIFTSDIEKGERLAREELEAGCCFVNDFVRSDPRLPFGGIKKSGYGRELAAHGIREFTNVKTIYVK